MATPATSDSKGLMMVVGTGPGHRRQACLERLLQPHPAAKAIISSGYINDHLA
jgi:hypothetical protein